MDTCEHDWFEHITVRGTLVRFTIVCARCGAHGHEERS